MRNSTKIDLKNVGWEVVGWIHLAQDADELRALLYTAINLRAS